MSEMRVAPELQTSPVIRVKGQRSRWHYPDERLTPNNCEILRDVNISERGVAEVRYGYDEYNATQLPSGLMATGLWQGTFAAGTTKVVVVGPLNVYTDTGSARVDITGTALTGGYDDRVRFVFTKDKVILNNAKDAPRYWAGDDTTPTNTAALSGVPFTKVKDIMVHQNLLMVAGPTEGGTYYPTRLRWCDINRKTYVVDIDTWPDTNRYEVYDGGPAIVGCVDNWGYALVFKEDGLYPGKITYGATGMWDFNLGEPRRGFSPIAKMSFVVRPEFVFGVAREGIFVIRPDLSVEIVNLDDAMDWFALDQDRLQYAQSWIREKDHQVRTLVSASGNTSGHNRILVWDWETGDLWWDRPYHAMNCGQRLVVSSVEYDLFGSVNGYLWKGNSSSYTNDGGNSISWQIKMAPNDFGLPGVKKRILNLTTWFVRRSGAGSVTVRAHIDDGRKRPVSGTLSLGTANHWNDPTKLWNAGYEWSQEDARVSDLYVNRVCECIAPEWIGTQPAGIVGYSCEYVSLEG